MKLNKDIERRFKNIKDSQSIRVVRTLSWAQSLHIAVKGQSLSMMLSLELPGSHPSLAALSWIPDHLWLTKVHNLCLWATLWLELTVHYKLNPKLAVPEDPKYYFTDNNHHIPRTAFIIHHVLLFTQRHWSRVLFSLFILD